ncbi:MAG: DUF4328 domain-containing protein [Novosphingobium sp.]
MPNKQSETQSGPLSAFSLIAVIFLGLFIFIAVVFTLLALNVLVRVASTTYYTVSTDFYVFDSAAMLFLLGSGLTAAAAVSLWTWRASANLIDWHIRGFSYSPAWAAACFWVPGANLVTPPRMMRELTNLSDGEIPELARQTVGMVTAWWTCFFIGVLVHSLLAFVVILPFLTGIHVTNLPGSNYALFCFGTTMLALAAFNLIKLLRRITVAQRSTTQVGDTFA